MKLKPNEFSPKRLLSVAVPILMVSHAHAIQFDFGEMTLTVDSQFSIGSSWRIEDQNASLLNYFDEPVDPTDTNSPALVDGNTANDGNLNYKKGDAFSQIFKGNHDIQVSYKNFGAFTRFKYWYDSAIENNSVEYGHTPSAIQSTNVVVAAGDPVGPSITSPRDVTVPTLTYKGKSKLNDSNFDDLSKGSGATLLDAFIYGNFDIGDMPLDVRLGKQVVSWGESTLIRGGVNQINSSDVSAFRRPGAAVKEGLLPVNMVYANLGLTESVSVEAFYQLEYQENVGDGCGTYFSTSDVGVAGCDILPYYSAGLGGYTAYRKLSADEPDADGQFGIAVRYFSDELGTEFGFYALNIHSRSPIGGQLRGDLAGLDYQISPAIDALNNGALYLEYPEDMKIVGLSFAGNAYGMALAGEVAHKIDTPIGINGTLMTTVGLTGGQTTGNQAEMDAYAEIVGNTGAGEVISGYRRFDITQVTSSVTFTKNRVLGASIVSVFAEVGMNYVHEFDDVLRYGKSSIYGGPTFDGDADTDSGFMTETAWGYRVRASANYVNAFAGVDLVPGLAFSHDVKGYSAQFQEDVKSLGLSLNASYLQRYDASISYNVFMGGDFNPIEDRDYLAISAGVQF